MEYYTATVIEKNKVNNTKNTKKNRVCVWDAAFDDGI